MLDNQQPIALYLHNKKQSVSPSWSTKYADYQRFTKYAC
nr:MAG TPA: hypothetical protein [Caudoviricetes sp.]